MPTSTLQLIKLEQEEISPSLEEGQEVDIDTILEDIVSNPEDNRWKDEHRLQQMYVGTPYYQRLQEKIRAAALLSAKIEQGYAIVCEGCGSVYEIGEWPFCGAGGHGKVISRNAQPNTVTAYYINRSTGKVWIPGQNKYREPLNRDGSRIAGYERHEVRNFHERDKFYKLMDSLAKKKYYSSLVREQQHFEPIFSEGRKQARQDVLSSESQSPEASYGREWLDKQIAKTEKEAAKKLNYSPNTYIDPWEYDNANLDDAGMDSLHRTLNEKQPLLSEKHKKAIGRAITTNKKVAANG